MTRQFVVTIIPPLHPRPRREVFREAMPAIERLLESIVQQKDETSETNLTSAVSSEGREG